MLLWPRGPPGRRRALSRVSNRHDPPHPPYDQLRADLGTHPEGHAALDDLHATMNASEPKRADVAAKVGVLRGIPLIEARIANWFESPAVQNWFMMLSDAGL